MFMHVTYTYTMQKLLGSEACVDAMVCKACKFRPKGVIIDATSMKIDKSKVADMSW